MRGLSFQIQECRGNPLQKILSCINITEYRWFIDASQTDVWDYDMENLLFQKEIYDGVSFARTIQKKHFVIFLKLEGYSTLSEKCNIRTYHDFLKSDCKILLLLQDCRYVTVYLKDFDTAKAMYYYALDAGFGNVQYLSEKNDDRNNMFI